MEEKNEQVGGTRDLEKECNILSYGDKWCLFFLSFWREQSFDDDKAAVRLLQEQLDNFVIYINLFYRREEDVKI